MKRITCIVHHHDERALLLRDELDPPPDLSDVGRGENVAAYRGVKKTGTDEAGVSGLVAGSATREERNAEFGRGGIDY